MTRKNPCLALRARRNQIALAILIAGLATAYFYNAVTGAMICVIAGMYAE